MSIVSSGVQHALADINGSTDLDNYAIDSATIFDIATDPVVGAVAAIGVVTTISDEAEGCLESGFSDLYYHRIWVIEKYNDLGNLVADQARMVELWNAYFADKTFTGYEINGDILVDGLASGTLNPLQSVLYDVSIPLVGAPSLEASVVWTFTDAESPTFTSSFVGQRVIPFVLRHNWVAPVLEQINFRTDVLGAISGKEQRLGLITHPRRRFEMSYLTLTALERAYLENTLFGWQGRTYAVPLWSDVTVLRSSAAEGTTVFDIDTVSRDFDIGGLLFITNGTTHDTLEIANVTAGTITTRTPSLNAYNKGSRVAPARLGTLESKVDLSRITNHIESIRLAWALQSDQISSNRRAAYTPVTYRDVEVFNISNDYSEDIGITQEVAEDISDNGTGLIRKKSIGDQSPRRTYPFRELRSRDELPQFIEWVYRRKGKLNPFWFVERTPSFFLQTDALSTDTTFVVKTGGYTQFAFQSAARRDIAIKTTAGWKYRRITGATLNEDGTETITLDSSLGVGLSAATEPMMCFLKFVRLSQDTVELSYESAGAIKTATSFADLLTNN